MLTMLVIGVGAALLFLLVEAVQVARGHGLAWDPWVRDTAARLHLQGTVAAVLLAALLLGVNAALSAWPVWLGAWMSRKLAEVGMNALHPTPRVIEHRDGRRAIVDGRTGAGYQRLPQGETQRDHALARWLNEKVQ